jgi:hypothetical protein
MRRRLSLSTASASMDLLISTHSSLPSLLWPDAIGPTSNIGRLTTLFPSALVRQNRAIEEKRPFIFSRCRSKCGGATRAGGRSRLRVLNGSGDISGIEFLRDMLGAVHIPGFNRETDRLLRSRVVTFRHEPREQLRIVRDDASKPLGIRLQQHT